VKRDPSIPPYLSFAIIARNAAPLIEGTFKSIRERCPNAEIVVVETCSSDDGATVRLIEQYADRWETYKGPRGDWSSSMPWFDDAAAARNRSFELCMGRWICWIDGDDLLPSPAEAERLLKLNGRWRPPPGNAKLEKGGDEPVWLEDLLRVADATHGDAIQVFWAPYLYRANEDGASIEWQNRERIVRRGTGWIWKGEAHEVLVHPDPAVMGKRSYLAHLLFVHCKKFSAATDDYALRRHFDVLIRKYEKGDRSTRDALYLANYARFLCPGRIPEFIASAYEAAQSAHDRYRTLVVRGSWFVEQGFIFDAMESFNAATGHIPQLPDAWFAGGLALLNVERYLEAGDWLWRGVSCAPGQSLSEVGPRDHQVKYRLLAALSFLKAGRRFTLGGRHDQAIVCASNAVTAIEGVTVEMAGPDAGELNGYQKSIRNEKESLEQVEAIRRLHAYLVKNDETIKARELLRATPHNLTDHPVIVELVQWAVKLNRHLTDPAAYAAFYDDDAATGAIPSRDAELVLERAQPRVRFLVEQVGKWKGSGTLLRVLEIGAFDGNIGIPVMEALPNVFYTAVETQAEPLERFKQRAAARGMEGRLATRQGLEAGQLGEAAFDVVVFFEVIEHVPDAPATIRRLLSHLKPGGRLFLSTPWGAFDRGDPADMVKRDPRGHVRAMMPRDLVEAVEMVGGRVLELGGCEAVAGYGASGWGATLHVMCEWSSTNYTRAMGTRPRPLSFVVPCALWDWNATHVEATGIGASEETIVYLGRELGRSGRDTAVYGPLPREVLTLEEVRDGVKYWPREQLHRIDRNSTVIVSRAPSFGTVLDNVVGGDKPLDKLLWLQDIPYPDLNDEVAAGYRKIVVLSEWHKKAIEHLHGVDPSRMTVINNFLLEEHFTGADPARRPHHFVYASSPDRGLINLLRLWPIVLDLYPDATLSILYGWEGCMRLAGQSPEWTARHRKTRQAYLELRSQKGVVELGRVNHAAMALEVRSAAAWLYPTGDFAETFCSTAVKARAAGCVPVCTRHAGLAESADCPQTQWIPLLQEEGDAPAGGPLALTVDPALRRRADRVPPAYVDAFAAAVRSAVETGEADRAKMSAEAIERFRLEAILPKWLELLRGAP